MRMNEIALAGRRPVDGYGPGGFRIDGAWHTGSLVLGPDGAQGFEGPLGLDVFEGLLARSAEIDVVLVGQGAEIAPLDRTVRAALEGAGFGVEIMSTASACRTYNVLLAEDRRVAAVLIAL